MEASSDSSEPLNGISTAFAPQPGRRASARAARLHEVAMATANAVAATSPKTAGRRITRDCPCISLVPRLESAILWNLQANFCFNLRHVVPLSTEWTRV